VFYTYMEAFLARYNAWREGREVAPSIERRPEMKQIEPATSADPADGRLAS